MNKIFKKVINRYTLFIIIGIILVSYSVINILQSKYLNIYEEIESGHSFGMKDEEIIIPPPPDKVLYPIDPNEGDNIGSLTIPVLKQEFNIYEGTSDKQLKRGIGHFVQSVLPGEEDNCVISGHRETVFSKIGKLIIGDKLILKTSAGTFTYEVSGTRIVDEDDRTVIVPTENAVLTMSTCYPFDIGATLSERYIVLANLMKIELNKIPDKYIENIWAE